MNDTNYPTCPDCGSEHAIQVSGADAQMSDLTNIDLDRAGVYRCGNCDSRYRFEAVMTEFSPRAKCPHCGGFETRVTALNTKTRKPFRYHICKSCTGAFRTACADRQ